MSLFGCHRWIQWWTPHRWGYGRKGTWGRVCVTVGGTARRKLNSFCRWAFFTGVTFSAFSSACPQCVSARGETDHGWLRTHLWPHLCWRAAGSVCLLSRNGLFLGPQVWMQRWVWEQRPGADGGSQWGWHTCPFPFTKAILYGNKVYCPSWQMFCLVSSSCFWFVCYKLWMPLVEQTLSSYSVPTHLHCTLPYSFLYFLDFQGHNEILDC